MAAAAVAVGPLLSEAQKVADTVSKEVLAWAREPFYKHTTTRTRSWVEIDKNGKAHTLTEVKTDGFSVSNGTVIGAAALFCLWEVGLEFANAIAPVEKAIVTAADAVWSADVAAFDAVGNMIGTLGADIQKGWDWLDGRGAQPSQTTPPAGTVKTVSMPSTPMAAMSQAFIGVLAPVSAGAQSIGLKIVGAIQNPPS